MIILFNISLEKIVVINNIVNILKIFILLFIILIINYFFRKRIFNKLNICLFSISFFFFFLPFIIKKIANIFYPKSNFSLYFLEKDIYEKYTDNLIKNLENTHDLKTYNLALKYVDKIKNNKSLYEEKLNNIKSLIDKENIPLKKGNIFIGDSRTYSYLYEIQLNEIDTVYATVSGASLEFKKDFAKGLDKINNNPDYKYNLIFNYGVNNLNEDWVSIYKKAIEEVGNKANILIVSVNPCNDNIAKSCRNANIEKLNNKLKNAFSKGYTNVKYCDTYTPFINTLDYSDMIEKVSGIHYTEKGTKLIYNNIEKCLNS